MTVENKSPGATGGQENISAEAAAFIAQKYQELKQLVTHLASRVEALEKQLGEAVDKDVDAAGKKTKAVVEEGKSWLEKLFN